MTVQAFWEAFLQETDRPADTPCLESFHFDLTEKWANELLRLVLEGKKRATSSSLTCYELEGEDDCLDSWRRSHINFFTAEGHEAGYVFTEDMPVIFEQFRVIYAK